MHESIYCEVIERFEREGVRVDLFYAKAKEVYWFETFLKGYRVDQSEGYASESMARSDYEDRVEQLPDFLRHYVERHSSRWSS